MLRLQVAICCYTPQSGPNRGQVGKKTQACQLLQRLSTLVVRTVLRTEVVQSSRYTREDQARRLSCIVWFAAVMVFLMSVPFRYRDSIPTRPRPLTAFGKLLLGRDGFWCVQSRVYIPQRNTGTWNITSGETSIYILYISTLLSSNTFIDVHVLMANTQHSQTTCKWWRNLWYIHTSHVSIYTQYTY